MQKRVSTVKFPDVKVIAYSDKGILYVEFEPRSLLIKFQWNFFSQPSSPLLAVSGLHEIPAR